MKLNLIFELFIALIIGIFAGTITGLIPGIHVNLVSLLALSLSPTLSEYVSLISISVFIISMCVTHSFLDVIPGVFLGAPDADQVLNVLPGHKLLLEGRGKEAVKLTVIGSLGSLILCILMIPLFLPLIRYVYPFIQPYISYILMIIVIFMIEKDKHAFKNFIIFSLSGVLGLIVLTYSNLNNPLFPLLSGLFGISMLLTSLSQKVKIPAQNSKKKINLSILTTVTALFSATFAGTLTSFFPGLGSSQGAVLASQWSKNLGDHGFMVLVGGINTVNFVLSLITLFLFDKARNGAIIVVKELIPDIDIRLILIFLASSLVVGGIASILTMKITNIFSNVITKISYSKIVWSIIILITSLTIYFGGIIGLLVLITSTAVGILTTNLGVAKNHSMGCLLLPVILFLL